MSNATAAATVSTDAGQYGNDARVEEEWARQAFEFAERHWLVRGKVPLTPFDDTLYDRFRARWPDMNVDHVAVEHMKSDAEKRRWREFLDKTLKQKLPDDWNFGTLLRVDDAQEYGPENTVLVPRGQFYCIEVARQRERGGNGSSGRAP